MTGMLRVAIRPRFLGLLALMVAATVACGMLATWQWERAHRARVEDRAQPAAAVPLAELITVGEPVTNAAAGRVAQVRGVFVPEQQVLIPGRSIDGQDAVIVVTALEVSQPDGSTARLAVARGWIPQDRVTGADGSLDPDRVPAPPAGTVQVTGHLEASETARQGLREGSAQELSTQLLVNEWGGPMYAAYLAETSTAKGLRPMPLAQSAFSRGLDWQNIGYAAQWLIFGAFFLYLWYRTVRAQHLDELAEAARADPQPAEPGEPAEPDRPVELDQSAEPDQPAENARPGERPGHAPASESDGHTAAPPGAANTTAPPGAANTAAPPGARKDG